MKPYFPKDNRCSPLSTEKIIPGCTAYVEEEECQQCEPAEDYKDTEDKKCSPVIQNCNKYATIGKCSECKEEWGVTKEGICSKKNSKL